MPVGQYGLLKKRNMNKKYAYFLLLACALLIFNGCGDIEFLKANPVDDDEEDEGILVKEPEFTLYKDGLKDKVVYAEEGFLFEGNPRLTMIEPRVEYYEKGENIANLVANSGVIYLENYPKEKKKKNDAVLEGNVTYKTKDGSMLKTQELIWDNQTEKLYTDSGFRFEQPVEENIMIIEGTKFVTDKNFKKWEKEGGPSIRMVPKKK
jgi:hypothetical protein